MEVMKVMVMKEEVMVAVMKEVTEVVITEVMAVTTDISPLAAT